MARPHGGNVLRPPAVVHVDLDGAQTIYEHHGWPYAATDDRLFRTGLLGALELLRELQITATLFVIARDLDVDERLELLREAVRLGHEIGSHTMSHPRLTTLSGADRRREIEGSKDLLEARLGVEVRGFRAPAFDTDREMLHQVAEAGYAYDSSLFADRATEVRLGVGRLAGGPNRLFPERDLMELALPGHRPLPVPFHPCYSLVLGSWYFRAGTALFRRRREPFVLLFHLTDFAEPLERSHARSARQRLYTLSHRSAATKIERCRRMVELVRRHYDIVTTEALLSDRNVTVPAEEGTI